MKYDIVYSCGHSETINIYGKQKDREDKIKYLQEKGLCPICFSDYQKSKSSKTQHND